MRLHKILLCIGLLLSELAYGSMYPVPVNVVVRATSDGLIRIRYQLMMQDIGAAGDKVIPSGYYTINGLAVSPSTTGPGYIAISANRESEMYSRVDFLAPGTTWSQHATKLWPSIQGKVAQLLLANYDGKRSVSDVCVGFGVIAGINDPARRFFNPEQIPSPNSCVNVPPLPNSCGITTSEVIFNHGTIGAGSVNDVQRSQLHITCNGTATMKFILDSGLQYIPLGESGGRATITVDNKALGTAIQMVNGQFDMDIESKITVAPPKGEWSGSGVLRIDLV